MKALKTLFLSIITIGYLFSTNVYSSTPVGNGSITFIGSVVESTCNANKKGLVCGNNQVLNYANLTSSTAAGVIETTSTKIKVVNKVKVNDRTLLATIQYH